MSDAAQNVAVLREAYQHWIDCKGTSGEHWMSLLADEMKFGSIAQGAEGAAYMTAYHTRDDVIHYFNGLARDWDMIEFVTEHFVAQDDRVVMLGRCSWRYKSNGKVVTTAKADSWRFADGRAVEFYEYFDTAQLRDAVAGQ
jgi:hypothetical protein